MNQTEEKLKSKSVESVEETVVESKAEAIETKEEINTNKEGKEMVISKSTGVTLANPQYIEMLKDLYSGEGFLYE